MSQVQLALLQKEFEQIEADLIARYRALGMESSGRWARELETEVRQDGAFLVARITGLEYTEQLEFGRRPGKFPPIEAIKQWINDKPINFISSQISISSLAFLIARKIATEGTRYFQQGGTDLIESVITPERIEGILNLVGDSYIQPIITGLVSQLESVSQT